jgi:iron(III) transport system ATP-binding protein
VTNATAPSTATAVATTALDVRGLSVAYGELQVLADVDLSVHAGALVAVLGPSGSGKSTLLRSIAGFIRPQAGAISVGGATVLDGSTFVPPERRRLGYVPQEGALFPHLDVAGNIAFGIGRGRRSERVAELLDLVGLSGFGNRRAHELSGGQQQRVALARALAPAPQLVLLDEPFAALDMTTRMEVRDDVRRVLRATGAAALLVTHDRDEALGWADLVAVVEYGRIVQIGTPVEVYLRPADLAVARSVGETVEMPAIVKEVDGRRFAVCALGEVPVVPTAESADITGSGTLMLRPSQFRLAQGDEDATSGVVVERYFTGEHTEITVLLPEGVHIHAHLPDAPASVVPGSTARLVTRGSGVLLPTAT